VSAAAFFSEQEGAPRAVWAFDRAASPGWNVIATVFGLREKPAARMMLLSTEPPPPPGSGPLWVMPETARRMRNDLLRALRADDGGAVLINVAGITFEVAEADAIERVLEAALELIDG
jgi:hypothetical protein